MLLIVIFALNGKNFIFYQNAHSIVRKISTLKRQFYLLTPQPDILVLTETWLQPNILSSELGLPDYDIFRYDRDLAALNVCCGGGVLIAVRKTLFATAVPIVTTNEQLFIKFAVQSVKLIIGAFYFQPDSALHIYENHCRIIEDISLKYSDHKLILLGDYNLRQINWQSSPLRAIANSDTKSSHRACAETVCYCYSGHNLAQHFPVHPD